MKGGTILMRKRWQVASLAMMLATLLLAGCGKGQKQTGDGAELTTGDGDVEAEVKLTLGFAVYSNYYADKYSAVAKSFEEKHPEYRIRFVTYDDVDSTGDCVLISLGQQDFYQYQEEWEPLEEVYQEVSGSDVLYESVLDFCRIDGSLRGVLSDFRISSIVARKEIDPSKWNQEDFISRAEDPGYLYLFNPVDNGEEIENLFLKLLLKDPRDEFLFGKGSEEDFDQVLWERLMDLADAKCKKRENPINVSEEYKKKAMFCVLNTLDAASDLDMARYSYGRDVAMVGYPTSEGGKHYLWGNPVVIRASASEEEKKVAKEFLLELLSYEGQKVLMENDSNCGISVRRDLYDEQMRSEYEAYANYAIRYKWVVLPATIEEDLTVFRELVDAAVPMPYFPENLEMVIRKLLLSYADGELTREELKEQLQKCFDF